MDYAPQPYIFGLEGGSCLRRLVLRPGPKAGRVEFVSTSPNSKQPRPIQFKSTLAQETMTCPFNSWNLEAMDDAI